LVESLVDKIYYDEKVVSSKKTYQIQGLCAKAIITLIKTKLAKIDTLSMIKTAKKPYPLGPNIPHIPPWELL